MSEQHVLADIWRFAQEADTFQAQFALSRFERLADLLLERSGLCTVRLAGAIDQQQRAWLDLQVQAQLVLCCQHCLGSLPWSLSCSSRLLLLRPGEHDEDEALAEDSYDVIEVADGLDLMQLAEEEILLALPIAPRHENDCLLPEGAGRTAKESPFAVLDALRSAPKA